MTHTLGSLLMRLEVMTKDEFNSWIEQQGYSQAEKEKIREDIIAQRKQPGKFSYGKIY